MIGISHGDRADVFANLGHCTMPKNLPIGLAAHSGQAQFRKADLHWQRLQIFGNPKRQRGATFILAYASGYQFIAPVICFAGLSPIAQFAKSHA